MPDVWVTAVDADGINVILHGEDVRLNFADIPGQGWNQNRLNKLRDRIQDAIDHRIPLTDPSLVDDPDALVDPGRPDFFHEGGDLVSRNTIVEAAVWDGERITLQLRRANVG